MDILSDYESEHMKDLSELVKIHSNYEIIHPFQDGNATQIQRSFSTPSRSEMDGYFHTQNERRIKHYEKDMETIVYGCDYPGNRIYSFSDNSGSTFNEEHMTVEGEDAYCIDINTNFKNGYKTRADASTRMSADQIADVALSLEYVKQYTDSHNGLSSQHAYLLRQLVVWQRLSVHLDWNCDNVRASYDEISKAVQDEVFARATYGMYSNKECKNSLGTLIVDANGNSEEIEVRAGTVYIKELTAPTGYQLDRNVYSLSVKVGETATLKVSDTPKVTDTLIELFKIDMETGKATAQGNASL